MDKAGVALITLYVIFVLLGFVIIGRIVWLGVFWDPDPKIVSIFSTDTKKTKIDPVRGSILACDGRLLAASMPMYQIYMDCTVRKAAFEGMKDKKAGKEKEAEWREKAKALSAGLAEIYGDRTAQGYYNYIISRRENKGMYEKIGYPIGYTDMKKVTSLPLFRDGQYKGGIIVEDFDTRQYPYGSLARRTIGYVKDNSTITNDKVGIEGRYNHELHGKEGLEWLKKTDNYELIHNWDSTSTKAVDGYDVRTTLDVDIQDIADAALRHNIAGNPKIEGGCVVVMDVETGAVRAMVNLLRDTTSGYLGETYNYAIGRAGEPGSVFKATTLMTLLEDGKVRLSDEIPTDHGMIKGFPGDDHIRDYERENKTDRISVLHGFEISSNYVFRRLAIDAYGKDPKRMIDKLYQYKLGETFDFDLDGFKSPTIPSPDSKYWSQTDLGSVAIGYSVAVTPLHTLTFYNAIANRGRMMKPYLVESIEQTGNVKKKHGPSVLNGSICSRSTADSLTYALRRVTEVGTGKRRLGGAKCQVAGKTGTARIVLDPKIAKPNDPYTDKYGRKQYQATFVGFFPAEKPKYSAIVVIYSRPDREIFYGGTLPAMTFREIVDKVWAIDPANGDLIDGKGKMPSWT